MNPWDIYETRINTHGGSKRNASYIREVRAINRKLPDNLSYQSAIIYPMEYGYNIDTEEIAEHSIEQNVAIINSDNLNEKTIISMPKEDIGIGDLVYWMDTYWLVTERDFNTTLYTKAKLLQCNHLLKWITDDHKIIEQWCVVEDGTKYLTGELEDYDFVTTRGDSRISVQLAKNKFTSILDRENRFLIDDDDSPHKLAYMNTKPFKTGLTYNSTGTFKFVMQEVTGTEYDNHELGIADYYLHFKADGTLLDDTTETIDDTDKRKKVWL